MAESFGAFFVHFKRPSPTTNKCWPTRVSQQLVCVKEATASKEKLGENRDEFYLSPKDYQHVVVSFTHTNLSLSARVGQHLFVVLEGCFKVVLADNGLYDYRPTRAIDATEYKWNTLGRCET